MQGKTELVKPARVRAALKSFEDNKDYSELARKYVEIKDWRKAARYYCMSILDDLDDDAGLFSAAYYLKEMASEGLHKRLFELALDEQTRRGDLWWQVRCLDELKW